jgi:hypothetical protein
LEVAAKRRIAAENAADGDDETDDEVQDASPQRVLMQPAASSLREAF